MTLMKKKSGGRRGKKGKQEDGVIKTGKRHVEWCIVCLNFRLCDLLSTSLNLKLICMRVEVKYTTILS